MSNFTESELIPAAVKIILKEKNGIETKDLIIELRNFYLKSHIILFSFIKSYSLPCSPIQF